MTVIRAKLLGLVLLAAAPGGMPAKRIRELPSPLTNYGGCWVQLNYRPLHLGVIQAPPNHTYLYVRDRSGDEWILEGRPEYAVPRLTSRQPWGRLRGHVTAGQRGFQSTDDAVHDSRQGERRNVSCLLVDRLRSELSRFDAGVPIPYYPAGANSNSLIHWLLDLVNLNVFGEPPNAMNWSTSVSGFNASD